jgi:prolyl-tRNA editing enzyme YbaK/EbsC (Cys-tRNA(Pro) deacylase)
MGKLHPSAERVQLALQALGFSSAVRELPQSTRTAPEAARAAGLSVGQIVKSLVFMVAEQPLLVCASGSNRVSIEKMSRLIGQPVRQASADEVREATGFAIGGVPPVGHTQQLRTIIDRDLMAYEEICAAAGTPHTVFLTTPQQLLEMTKGELADVKED